MALACCFQMGCQVCTTRSPIPPASLNQTELRFHRQGGECKCANYNYNITEICFLISIFQASIISFVEQRFLLWVTHFMLLCLIFEILRSEYGAIPVRFPLGHGILAARAFSHSDRQIPPSSRLIHLHPSRIRTKSPPGNIRTINPISHT